MGEDSILTVIGPIACPLTARANKKLGGRNRAHWSGEGSLAAEQRARVRAAFRRCSDCGTLAIPYRLPGRSWAEAGITHGCKGHRASYLLRRQLPYGPDRPADVLMLRVPSHGGRPLDDDGLQMALKAIRDQIAEELWPRDASGKPIGKVDDSMSWLRWLYGERRHRKPRKRRLPGFRAATIDPDHWPPPDPSNVGTELLEIVIAPRCVCRCFCGELREAAREWARGGRTARSAGEAAREDKLLRAIERIRDKPCGCGDVPPLKQRWLGGDV